nr:hypothetical protein [Tanacetum cinerariifolium]
MPPKRTSTSEASSMTHAAIRKLVADSATTALKAQAATMASTNNPNRNSGREKLLYQGSSLMRGLRIEGTPPMATTTILTTTPAMITTNSRIRGKKPLGLIQPTKGTMENFLCVRDALYITQDLVLSDVRLVTKWAIRPGTVKTKDPRSTRLDPSYSF